MKSVNAVAMAGEDSEDSNDEEEEQSPPVRMSQCTALGLRTSLDILGDLYHDNLVRHLCGGWLLLLGCICRVNLNSPHPSSLL